MDVSGRDEKNLFLAHADGIKENLRKPKISGADNEREMRCKTEKEQRKNTDRTKKEQRKNVPEMSLFAVFQKLNQVRVMKL